MNNDPIIINQYYKTSVEKVWKAITNKDCMKSWYFDFEEFKPEPGFEFRFTGGPSEDRQYLHICSITEVINEMKLAYSWCYDGYQGYSLVTFELENLEDQCLLRLTHEGLASFPETQPDFARENFEAGWKWIIETSLKNYLETFQ